MKETQIQVDIIQNYQTESIIWTTQLTNTLHGSKLSKVTSSTLFKIDSLDKL